MDFQPRQRWVLNIHARNEFFFLFFFFCSEEKAESIAEYKDELEQTKTMVAKLRQEVGHFLANITTIISLKCILFLHSVQCKKNIYIFLRCIF